MTELPSGTVTFLFTDIEGSTALLKQLGEGFFSARMGCQINHPVYSIDLAALCIRPR